MKSTNVNKVVLCGIETHVCILQTCVDLRRNNFDVYLPVDAVGSQRREDHDVALKRLENEGVKLTTTESIIFELLKDSNHDSFRDISSLVKDRAELLKKLDCSDGNVLKGGDESSTDRDVLGALFGRAN